jgi:hypothetical protein
MRRVLLSAFISGVTALSVLACSSDASEPRPTSTAPTALASTPTTTPVATASGSISRAAPGTAAVPGLPAVTGGIDVTKKPTVSIGSEPLSVLVVRDLVVGTGSAVSPTATVKVKYVGALFTTGTVFDTSWGKTGSGGADTATFALSGVIPGFAQGLIGMNTGGRREIVIPPSLGYGASATRTIPANSTLVFVVDLVSTSG